MKKIKVVVSSTSFSRTPQLVSELSEIAEILALNPDSSFKNSVAFAAFLNSHKPDVLLLGTEKFDENILSKLNFKLKFISKYGVGIDNVDLDCLQKNNIGFGHVAGTNKRSVAELALCFMIAHFRNVVRLNSAIKQGQWIKDGGKELSELKIGILGFGNTGSELARLLYAFEPEIYYFDLLPKEEIAKNYNAKKLPLKEMLKTCDVISLHVPYSEKNHHIITKTLLDSANKDLLLINTSRGNVVDFNAVVEAVKNKLIAGFATDVYPVEPTSMEPYSSIEGLIFTPHIGGNSSKSVLNMGRAAISEIKKFAQNNF